MVALTVVGCSVAALGGGIPLAIAVGVVALLLWYNRRLSSRVLSGNAAIAALGALPILFGGFCARGADPSGWKIAATGALIAFWVHLAREILKDSLDRDADQSAGRRTLAIILPVNAATRWSALPILTACTSAIWLGIQGWLGILYLVGVSVTVAPALLLGAAQCLWVPSDETASRWSAGLKLVLLAGLIWMLLGRALP